MPETILPSNASDLERAVDKAGARVETVPAPLRTLWQPQAAPAGLLPWIAWGLSVDVWRSDWDEAKKRVVVNRAYDLHRKKGTLAGVRATLDILDAPLQKAVTPPNKTFLSPNFTEAERRAWLERFPEIRIFRQRDAATQVGAIPAPGSWSPAAKWYLNANLAVTPSYLVRSTAPKRSQARVLRVEPDGTETELTVTNVTRRTVRRTVVTQRAARTVVEGPVASGSGDTLRFVEKARRGHGAMLSDPASEAAGRKLFLTAGARRFLADQRAFERTYLTTLVDELYEPRFERARTTVQPLRRRATSGQGLFLETGDPIFAQAERVAESGTWRGTFAGVMFPSAQAGTRFTHLAEQGAGSRLFQRSRLFDSDVAIRSGVTSWHLGARRLSMPAYNAVLQVRISNVRARRRFGRFFGDFLIAADRKRMTETTRALRWSVSKRDRVLVNTTTRETVNAGNDLFAGRFAAGGVMEAS